MNSILRSILLVIFFVSLSAAQGSSTGLSILKVPKSAIQASLGGAAVTTGQSLGVISVNPASMLYPDDRLSVLFTHTAWIQGITANHLAVSLPTPLGRIQLNTGMSSIPDIEVRSQPGPPSSTFSARTAVIGGGWGTELFSGILCAVSASYIYDRLYDVEATGLAVSGGLLASSLIDNVTFGASVGNVGSVSGYKGSTSNLPLTMTLGGAYDLAYDDIRIRPAVAYRHIKDGASGIHAGITLGYEFVEFHGSIRTGESARTASFGTSIAYKGITVNYALIPFSAGFDSSHLITLGLEL